MNAYATLPAIPNTGVTSDPPPLVLLDGVPEPALAARWWQATGPLDERSAALDLDPDAGLDAATLTGRTVAIVTPLRLRDRTPRWQAHLVGRVEGAERDGDAVTLRVGDDWGRQLQHGQTSAPSATRLDAAVQQLAAWSGVGLLASTIPADRAAADTSGTFAAGEALGQAWRALLMRHGLRLRRHWRRVGDAFVPTVAVAAADTGRRVALRAEASGAIGRVLRTTGQRRGGATQWTARSPGWRIESTFVLAPAWDPSRAAEADDHYTRSTNVSFAAVGDVFRLWVLNEDGAFSGPPIAAPAFDLAAFFGDPLVPAAPLPFAAPLTRTPAGARRAVTVEHSVDGGATWLPWGGAVRIATDRAAVYLDDDALPPAFLAAARSGAARVRATATLRSPHAVEASRWSGNALHGLADQRMVPADDLWFARVLPGSVFHAQVRSGTLEADEADDTLQMTDRLVRAAAGGPAESVTVELAGACGWLGVGDRVEGSAVDSVRCSWRPVPATTLRLTGRA